MCAFIRFIPACAGNTCAAAQPRCQHSVHPRVRGEHPSDGAVGRRGAGSSPRARGTPLPRKDQPHGPRRFIPACAGNTLPDIVAGGLVSVHPRVRGEHLASLGDGPIPNGSSPRARGTRDGKRRLQPLAQRFIPACAGNTDDQWARSAPGPVHPRVRGEHIESFSSRARDIGSSPRARGTRIRSRFARRQHRFIPACAGNTDQELRGGILDAVHPRVRGEHCPRYNRHIRELVHPRVRGEHAAITASMPARGSVHPRVRGEHEARLTDGRRVFRFIPACAGNTRRRDGHPERRLRFIPACAGNTRLGSSLVCRRAVHPRVRGEHVEEARRLIVRSGSSPRARGTRRTRCLGRA